MAQERTPRREYLDPKQGEHLPEKEVSSKAYSRLGLCADAIAATKKAISHQGNQVPALEATNMNSYYRLQAMRDERCWEFTTTESYELAMENPEALFAAQADLARGGNCGEHAWVAYHYLRLKAKGQPIQVSAKSGLDHAFVIMGDLKKDKDNEMAVSDPWPNNPTATLWEDHFAFTPQRDQIEVMHSGKGDGKSFKEAIKAGLRMTDFGKRMITMKDSDKETKAKTDDWKANHFWQQDDAAAEGSKFHYKPQAALQGAQAGLLGGDTSSRTGDAARER